MAQLADIWYSAQGCDYGRTHHYNDSRYHMLNLHATFTKGTVEFRLFQFDKPAGGKQNGLHAGKLKSYIQLCLAMSQMAKDLRSASPKEQQKENKKFAMRTWLMRITAFVLVFPPTEEDDHYYILPYFWLPEETLDLRVRRDHDLYDLWLRRTVPVTGQPQRKLRHPILQLFLRTDSCRKASQ